MARLTRETLSQDMVKSMQSVGVSVFIQGANPPAGTANGSSGADWAQARRSRFYRHGLPQGTERHRNGHREAHYRSVACLHWSTHDVTNKTNGSVEDEEEEKMIDLDIFGAILPSHDLRLNDENLLLLADSTDRHPLANRINCDVLLDTLLLV